MSLHFNKHPITDLQLLFFFFKHEHNLSTMLNKCCCHLNLVVITTIFSLNHTVVAMCRCCVEKDSNFGMNVILNLNLIKLCCLRCVSDLVKKFGRMKDHKDHRLDSYVESKFCFIFASFASLACNLDLTFFTWNQKHFHDPTDVCALIPQMSVLCPG